MPPRRQTSRANSAVPVDGSQTPRRSSRLASLTPKPAPTEPDQHHAKDGHVGWTRRPHTNAGHTGRLRANPPKTSSAYGGQTHDPSVAQPETTKLPDHEENFQEQLSRHQAAPHAAATRGFKGPDARQDVESMEEPPSTPPRARREPTPFQSSPPEACIDSAYSPDREISKSPSPVREEYPYFYEEKASAYPKRGPTWIGISSRILLKLFTPIVSFLSTVSKISGACIQVAVIMLLVCYIPKMHVISTVDLRSNNFFGNILQYPLHVINILTGANADTSSSANPVSHIVQGEDQQGSLVKYIDSLWRNKDQIVVVLNESEDGKELPKTIQDAILSHLAQDHVSHGTADDSPAWTHFRENNENLVQAVLSGANDDRLQAGKMNVIIVGKSVFTDIVEKELERLESRVADMELDHQKINSTLQDVVGGLSKAKLASTTNKLLIDSEWKTRNAVNYFSPDQGARINRYQTSPTMAQGKLSWRVLRSLAWMPSAQPPTAAITDTKYPPECWCAARSPGTGQAQLGVITGQKIVPHTLVVEHIRGHGTHDISCAPRGIEVWAEVESDEERATMPAIADGPGPKYVHLGSFEYLVDDINHVQAFSLNAENLNPVQNFVIRVTDSWGRDRACLYPLRLNGRTADEA